MFNKIGQRVRNLYRGQKGITGLETAIILIAFVTVAAVLAYTVLSAGIFSSERGKEAVYAGLNSAQSTMDLKSSVLAEDADDADNFSLEFSMAMALPGSSVDLTKLVFNYFDSIGNKVNGIAAANIDFTIGGAAATSLTGSDQVLVVVDMAAEAGFAAPLTPYSTFTLQIIPPTGATITVQRSLPGAISGLISLN
jgi:flagellin FlaB